MNDAQSLLELLLQNIDGTNALSIITPKYATSKFLFDDEYEWVQLMVIDLDLDF